MQTAICDHMNESGGHYAKEGKTEAERKYCVISHICGI